MTRKIPLFDIHSKGLIDPDINLTRTTKVTRDDAYDNTDYILHKYNEILNGLSLSQDFNTIVLDLNKHKQYIDISISLCLREEDDHDKILKQCLPFITYFTKLLSLNFVKSRGVRSAFRHSDSFYSEDYFEKLTYATCHQEFDERERPIDVYYLLLLPYSIRATQCLNKFLSADYMPEGGEELTYLYTTSFLTKGLSSLISRIGVSTVMKTGEQKISFDKSTYHQALFAWWTRGWSNFIQFISCVFFSSEGAPPGHSVVENKGSIYINNFVKIITIDHPFFSSIGEIHYFETNRPFLIFGSFHQEFNQNTGNSRFSTGYDMDIKTVFPVEFGRGLHVDKVLKSLNIYAVNFGQYFYNKVSRNLKNEEYMNHRQIHTGDERTGEPKPNDENKKVESIIDDTLKMDDSPSDDSSIQSLVSSHNSVDHIPSELMAISQHFNIPIEDVAEFIENEIISTFDFKLIIENFKEDLTSVDYINSFNKLCSNTNIGNIFNFAKYIDAELCSDIPMILSSTYNAKENNGPAFRSSILFIIKVLKEEGFLFKLTLRIFKKLFNILQSIQNDNNILLTNRLKLSAYFVHYLNLIYGQISYTFIYYHYYTEVSKTPVFSSVIIYKRYFLEFIMTIHKFIFNSKNDIEKNRTSFFYLLDETRAISNKNTLYPFLSMSNVNISNIFANTIFSRLKSDEFRLLSIIERITFFSTMSKEYIEFKEKFISKTAEYSDNRGYSLSRSIERVKLFPKISWIKLGLLNEGIYTKGLSTGSHNEYYFTFLYIHEELIDYIPEKYLPIFLFRLIFRHPYPTFLNFGLPILTAPLYPFNTHEITSRFNEKLIRPEDFIGPWLLHNIYACHILYTTLDTIGLLLIGKSSIYLGHASLWRIPIETINRLFKLLLGEMGIFNIMPLIMTCENSMQYILHVVPYRYRIAGFYFILKLLFMRVRELDDHNKDIIDKYREFSRFLGKEFKDLLGSLPDFVFPRDHVFSKMDIYEIANKVVIDNNLFVSLLLETKHRQATSDIVNVDVHIEPIYSVLDIDIISFSKPKKNIHPIMNYFKYIFKGKSLPSPILVQNWDKKRIKSRHPELVEMTEDIDGEIIRITTSIIIDIADLLDVFDQVNPVDCSKDVLSIMTMILENISLISPISNTVLFDIENEYIGNEDVLIEVINRLVENDCVSMANVHTVITAKVIYLKNLLHSIRDVKYFTLNYLKWSMITILHLLIPFIENAMPNRNTMSSHMHIVEKWTVLLDELFGICAYLGFSKVFVTNKSYSAYRSLYNIMIGNRPSQQYLVSLYFVYEISILQIK